MGNSRRTSDNQGAEGVVRAGLNERGQKLSKQDVRVKQRVSVALFVSSAENWEGEGSADETIEDRREGESERRLRRKVTCGGACAMSGVSVRLEVMRKWSEVCSGVANVLSVEQ